MTVVLVVKVQYSKAGCATSWSAARIHILHSFSFHYSVAAFLYTGTPRGCKSVVRATDERVSKRGNAHVLEQLPVLEGGAVRFGGARLHLAHFLFRHRSSPKSGFVGCTAYIRCNLWHTLQHWSRVRTASVALRKPRFAACSGRAFRLSIDWVWSQS